jgi:hypothetical protein
MFDSKNPLLNSGIILAVTTAFLYCIDAAYYEGYLNPLLLDANMLDRNFHQALFNGFLVFFFPVASAFSAYAVAHFLYSHHLLPDLNKGLRSSREKRRRLLRLKHAFVGPRKGSLSEQAEKRRSIRMLTYFVILIAFIGSLAHALARGKKDAVEFAKKIDDKSLPESAFVVVKIDDQRRKLFYLTCGARNCAGIDPATKIVYYFPQTGHSFQYAAKVPTPASTTAVKAP